MEDLLERIIPTIISIVLIGFSLIEKKRIDTLKKVGVISNGVVNKVRAKRNGHEVEVKFVTNDEEKKWIKGTTRIGSGVLLPPPSTGDEIEVLYHPDDPYEFEINSNTIYLKFYLFFALGILLFLYSLYQFIV